MSDEESDGELGHEPEPEAPLGPHVSPPLNQVECRCGHYTFSSCFCSGNMARAEVDEDDDTEFNVWTNPDCAGTSYETTCRSWFFFSVKGGKPDTTIGITIMNSNVQNKLCAHPEADAGANSRRQLTRAIFSFQLDRFHLKDRTSCRVADKKGYRPVWRSASSSTKWAPVGKHGFCTTVDEVSNCSAATTATDFCFHTELLRFDFDFVSSCMSILETCNRASCIVYRVSCVVCRVSYIFLF
eukprot:SAG11_NODE_3523_length_2395_cov_1.335801_2_plen_241_part_00